MKYLPLCFLILLGSCASKSDAPKSEKYQMEMTLHKTRSELEESKHDLHTLKMELLILEGKMNNHEEQMAAIKKETFDLHQTKLENCHVQIATLEKKFSELEGRQDEINKELQKITTLAKELSKALAQSKEKTNELERALSTHTKNSAEFTKKIQLALDQNSKSE